MALTRLNTDHFSDVELAAEAVAKDVESLQFNLAAARSAALMCWVGKGRTGFEDLYFVIERQIKDISKEFWSIYEALCDAEGSYIQADQDVATQINAAGGE